MRTPSPRVPGSLVAVMRDAEHFDPFFANACIACAQQLLGAQVRTVVPKLRVGTPSGSFV